MSRDRRTRAEITFAVEHEAAQDGGGPVRFHGVAYSGQPVEQYGKRFVVDLAAVGEAEIPVLTDHDNEIDALAGRGRIFTAEGDDGGRELRIEGQLSRTTEAGRQISGLLAEGFPVRMSIGFKSRFEEVSEETDVNGRKLRVDFVLRDPAIHEVSFVAVPADQFAGVREVLMCADLASGGESGVPTTDPTTDPEVARLTEALADAEARAEAAEAELANARRAWREAEIFRLFAMIDRDPPEDVSAYLDMSDAAFAVWAEDIQSLGARPLDPALTSAVSPNLAVAGGGSETPSQRLMHVVERLSRGGEKN